MTLLLLFLYLSLVFSPHMASPALSTKGCRMVHLNCQSLVNKTNLVKFHVTQYLPDIFGLSETWFNPNLPNNLSLIPNYDLIRVDRAWIASGGNKDKCGGGVGLYVKSNLNYSQFEYALLNRSTIDINIVWVSLHQPIIRKKKS